MPQTNPTINPKPCEMWAVYHSSGYLQCIHYSPERVKATAMRMNDVSSWDTLLSLGFSIHRVTVTPIVEDTK